MRSTFTAIALASMCLSLNASADAWDSANDPSTMDSAYQYNFAKLPLQGELAKKPWAETYWETALGSINIRWNQPNPVGFNYHSPSRAEVMNMTADQIAVLSPSEKFDIYTGNYNYPLHGEVSGFASPHTASWRGLCNGWSMAAVQYDEPQPKTVKNADGVSIPFGSSDIKALLSYYAQMRSKIEANYVGGQCRGLGHLFHNSACSDINPGAMHVVMANQLGLKNQAFMMDRDPGTQIWNQPVYGFSTVVKGSAQSKYASGVLVHTTLTYTDELDKSSFVAVGGTPQFTHDKMEMDYILDLDASGNIVGGSYVGGSDHPDLFWLPQAQVKLEDDFTPLNNLL